LEAFDLENLYSDPSNAELLQFLDSLEPKHAAQLAYQWLESRLLLQHQIATETKEGLTKIVFPVNLWEMLSSLARFGESMDFTIDASVQNNKMVFVIGNIPEEKSASVFIEELLTLIFAKLAKVESNVTHTRYSTTARVSMM
jgi:hypothetical protein